ncbi:MAG: hypothetical protein WKF75_18690 [Singulisphaera sp.]
MEDPEIKKPLYLLNEMNDVEVIVLRAYADFANGDEGSAFREKHRDVLRSPQAHMGSLQEVVDKQWFYDSYRNHLVGLNLLRRNRHDQHDRRIIIGVTL